MKEKREEEEEEGRRREENERKGVGALQGDGGIARSLYELSAACTFLCVCR